MSEELKPCPFCGGKARIVEATSYGVCAECQDCNCRTGLYGSREQAIIDWNRRAEQPNELEEIPEMITRAMRDIKDACYRTLECLLHTVATENKPLAVDELRKMDGDPVWVKAVDPNDSDTNYWAIVSANMHYSHKSGGVISTSTDGVAVVAIAYFEDYGKTWLAYRRPPEAGENK